MTITVLISVTGHVVIAGNLLFLPICTPLPSASTSITCDSLHSGVTQIFIPEGLGLVVFLPGLCC